MPTIESIRSRVALLLVTAGFLCAASTIKAEQIGLTDAELYRSADRGFLFVDGEYIPRPDEFRKEGDSYFVNEIDLAEIGIDLSLYEREAKDRQERRVRKKKPPRKGLEPITRLHADIALALHSFDTVLLIPGFTPVCYENAESGDLLRALVTDKKQVVAWIETPKWHPLAPADQQRWTEHLTVWLASFQPSATFLADATARIEVLDSIETANDLSSAATLRLATFGYPLTILMTILVVLGFGHLLSHRPNTDEWNDDSPTNQLSEPFNRSLLLIAGLSAVDLVWTLLVSQAGAMHELNPLGSRMIDAPLQLVAFKVLVTLSAIGLLYFCRRVPLARQASWWGCLVLTLVAARWLVFNSMFIS